MEEIKELNKDNLVECNGPGGINVFIIGLRGYVQNYGGWEAFAHGMLDNWKDKSVNFYAFEKVDKKEDEGIEVVNGITCIRIFISHSGNSAMMIYDAKATFHALRYIKANNISNPIMYHLGVRIGPIMFACRPIFKKAGIVLMENPAGIEWKRTKWNKLVQVYLAISAYLMAKSTDYLICDSKGVRDVYCKMIRSERIKKEYISYGSYPVEELNEYMPENVAEFFKRWNIEPNEYFLILGRFVPENNYEMMIKGFMESKTSKKLVIVCNYQTEISKFHEHILNETNYTNDHRIKMVGTMYDKLMLKYLRQYAAGYIHGHSVGGTNPGLLEAMSATDMNLLYDVIFNREVGGDAAVYFKDAKSLSNLIDKISSISTENKITFGQKAKQRMRKLYSWDYIVKEYNRVFHMAFEE